jgi:hypothetical protein
MPYYAVGTRVSFDLKETYQKFVFAGIRMLTDDEAVAVKELQDDPQVARILQEDHPDVEPEDEAVELTAADVFEQPPMQPLPAPLPPPPPPSPTKPKLEVVKTVVAPPPTVPDEHDTGEVSQFGADLDAQLDALLRK